MTFWEWLAANWPDVVKEFALPAAAILIPTIIAITLARRERVSASENAARQRKLDAGAQILLALAPLASMQADERNMQQHLWDLRARVAVYRAWISPDDISGDWLAYRHKEGMLLWVTAMYVIDALGGPSKISDQQLVEFLGPPHRWAAMTSEMLAGWLRGDVVERDLAMDGERIRLSLPDGDSMKGPAAPPEEDSSRSAPNPDVPPSSTADAAPPTPVQQSNAVGPDSNADTTPPTTESEPSGHHASQPEPSAAHAPTAADSSDQANHGTSDTPTTDAPTAALNTPAATAQQADAQHTAREGGHTDVTDTRE